MLVNVNAINEVVRHVTFIEYQLYEETDTTITSSSVRLNSLSVPKLQTAPDLWRNSPLAMEVCPIRTTHQVWCKTKLRTVIENKNIFRTFSSKTSHLEMREFHSPWGEPALLTVCGTFWGPPGLCVPIICLPARSEIKFYDFPFFIHSFLYSLIQEILLL